MSVHEGHRERLKERFSEYGLEPFNDLNALELLLFYAIPRRDTNELAHALLERFGTLDAVFEASERELTEVPGIGRSAAMLIRLIPQMNKRCEICRARDVTVIANARAAGRYLIPRFANEKDEKALLLCLNAQKELIECDELSRGVVNTVELNVRRVVETAIRCRASSVILAHNHPSGHLIPSGDDELITRRIRDALRLVDITLDDHLIVGGKQYFSFNDSGLLTFPITRQF
ncbi:MAG: DNA repair protein RadC [Oscillospiraceae bacterium]|nr:DNA repair protein RadC [Oscillospiraceae bacterium]